MLRTRLMLFAVLAAALALPSIAHAQALGVNYFDNASSTLPDGTVRITTPHLRVIGTGLLGHGPDQCALIYVLKPDQEIAACCGCKLTPNQLLKLSVNNNLTANTLTGTLTGGGTIAIVPSLPNHPSTAIPPGPATCDAGLPPIATSAVIGTAFVTAWATHVQDSGAITEDDFDFSESLGARATINALWLECQTTVQGQGSGAGVCSCTDTNGVLW